MSNLLNSLRSNTSTRLCPLSTNDKSDLSWCCHSLPYYNGISLIKTTPGYAAHFSYLRTARAAIFKGNTFTLPSRGTSSNITSSTFWQSWRLWPHMIASNPTWIGQMWIHPFPLPPSLPPPSLNKGKEFRVAKIQNSSNLTQGLAP